MKQCPICETVSLRRRTEAQSLQTSFCDACHGHWLEQEDLEAFSVAQSAIASSGPFTPDIVEAGRSMVCPNDGNLMIKYRLMVGVEFYMDRCTDCGGIWLDRQEWQILQSGEVSINLANLCNGLWQERTIQEQASSFINVRRDEVLKDLLSDDEYCELSRIRHWLDRHPKRREVIGSLLSGEAPNRAVALAQ